MWDTGIGIAEADLTRLFQPFTQLDSRLNRAYEGTGLGLALVKRLAEAHGGRVSVESTPGQGSRFSVTLPWVGPEERAAEPPSLAAPVLPPAAPHEIEATILLIEDNASNVAVIRDMLETQGYRLAVAGSGSEGLTLVREVRPALVLMDIQLPGMSGIEVIRRMRADAQLRDLPIVALTALVMPGDRECCLEAGVNAYLAKPVNAITLLETIAALLGRPSSAR